MSKSEQLITEHIDIWTSAILAKSTAGRGSSKKYELYGIKKLRELILELAVRGKLVSQDANDESAEYLLEKIATGKARLVEEKKIKKSKILSKIEKNECAYQLPKGWAWVRLGEILNIFNGNSINATIKESKYGKVTNGLPYIATKDVNYGFESLIYDNGIKIPEGEPKFKIASTGSVLICAEGGSAGKKCGLTDRDIYFGNKLYANEVLDEGLEEKFILISFLSPIFFNQFSSSMTGIIGGISLAKFSHLVIAVPPEKEQKRIVTKVDELMLLCDQLEQQTETSIDAHATLVGVLLATLTDSADANELAQNWIRVSEYFDSLFTTEQSIEALKQTVLQLAVMGKLVPQNPEDEPASVLIEKIAVEKVQLIKDKKIKRAKPLPLISDDEKPFDLPRGWEWCRLPEVGELARGKSKHRPRNAPELFSGGTIPLVQTGDVARADNVITTYTSLYNKNGLEQSRLWPTGTLCITIAANIADTAKLGFDACFPDSVVGFLPYEKKIDISYFDYFLRTAKNHLEDFAPSTAQKNINLEILGSLLVPLPPLNELNEITRKVKVLFSLCDQLKETLQQSQVTQVQLTDALIEKALA